MVAMLRLAAILLLATVTVSASGSAQNPAEQLKAANPVVPVWTGVPPGSEGKPGDEAVRVTDAGEHVVSSVHRPTITVYLPRADRATGAGVVVMPGGGHRELWVDHEGHNVAAWLSERGVAAFVLKYRLARETGSTYTIDEHAFRDAQRAIRLVRSRSTEWKVAPDRVGVMGFSAGGEIAALMAMKFDDGVAGSSDPVERFSSRPAFQGLVYPGRSGSIQPTKDSPPAFLACGFDDRPDISEGLAQVYLLFKKAGVQTELHVYSGVGHGFGLRSRTQGPVREWPQRFLEWLGHRGFLEQSSASADARLRALYTEEWNWRQQELARAGDSPGDLSDRFPKVDPASQQARLVYWTKALATLDAIPFDQRSAEEKINAQVFPHVDSRAGQRREVPHLRSAIQQRHVFLDRVHSASGLRDGGGLLGLSRSPP